MKWIFQKLSLVTQGQSNIENCKRLLGEDTPKGVKLPFAYLEYDKDLKYYTCQSGDRTSHGEKNTKGLPKVVITYTHLLLEQC